MDLTVQELHRRGELARRAAAARELLSPCRVCPRACGVDRLHDDLGECGIGARARVASAGPHHGEEPPLVGTHGSGTVFFGGCNLGCVFCQNHDISQGPDLGRPLSDEELARVFLGIQARGCHNLNLVTPTHVVPQVLAALDRAAAAGLDLPVVYNCGGYESPASLALLDGVVDVYMPDVKLLDAERADRYCRAADYPEVVRAALREMHRQVGDLRLDSRGLATGGLLVRHLVLPDDLAGTAEVMRFLADLSPWTYVNVMAQYRPCHRAQEHPELARRTTRREHAEAVRLARAAGLEWVEGARG